MAGDSSVTRSVQETARPQGCHYRVLDHLLTLYTDGFREDLTEDDEEWSEDRMLPAVEVVGLEDQLSEQD